MYVDGYIMYFINFCDNSSNRLEVKVVPLHCHQYHHFCCNSNINVTQCIDFIDYVPGIGNCAQPMFSRIIRVAPEVVNYCCSLL